LLDKQLKQQQTEQYLRGTRVQSTISSQTSDCTPTLPRTKYNRWLLADSVPSGLCNQFSGIYSYITAAFYYNTSLIVGDLYSRTSFDYTCH
jgi:hypothetical protein